MSSPEQEKYQPASPGGPTRPETGETAEGATIGPYRLLEQIGQGGMGEVWLAEQTQPVRRRVAIKLIKAGMDTREVVTRFASERQALALMDHPAIAKVFDAGSTPQGRLYFVMEYVQGMPITDYCDQHRLTISQRLELFSRVCEGVQHAHQKAILHRDLKPSNILVGEMDGKPMPRIIDFGVAKAISRGLGDDTVTTFTHLGSVVGTPAYMSPEQADSAGQDVDTRTDVYSLGVVLYELLVGTLPFDITKVPLSQLPQKLREDDAPSPSTKLRSLDGQSSTTAQNRHTDAPTLVRQLQGDLDAITLKALEKERSRRYASPAEFSADIGRYLRQETVLARPASAAYRAGKYIRRHRIGVALTAAAALLLVSFTAVQAVQLRRITRERDRANRERDRANRERNRADRITTFMTDMFKVSDPGEARGNSITAREILDKASKRIDAGLSKDPELQAQMAQVMAEVYDSLGLYSRAQSLLERATNIRNRVLGSEHPDTLASITKLASVMNEEGNYSNAEKLHRQVFDVVQRTLGPNHTNTLILKGNIAFDLAREARFAESERLFRETLISLRRTQPDGQNTLTALRGLAGVVMEQARYAEAEKLFREALDLDRRHLGPDRPETLSAMGDLANVLDLQGRYAESEQLHRQTLDAERRILGPEHPSTLLSMAHLATTLSDEGHYAESETLQRETLEIRRRVLGPDHPDVAGSLYNLGCLMALQGRRTEALSLLRDAIDHGLYAETDLEIEKDSDLASLHGDPRFIALAAHAKERAAAARGK